MNHSISFRYKKTKPYLTFQEQLFNYTIRLDGILERLAATVSQGSSNSQTFWIAPVLPRWHAKTSAPKRQFSKVCKRLEYFATKHGFSYIDQGALWCAAYPPYLLSKASQFSALG